MANLLSTDGSTLVITGSADNILLSDSSVHIDKVYFTMYIEQNLVNISYIYQEIATTNSILQTKDFALTV